MKKELRGEEGIGEGKGEKQVVKGGEIGRGGGGGRRVAGAEDGEKGAGGG